VKSGTISLLIETDSVTRPAHQQLVDIQYHICHLAFDTSKPFIDFLPGAIRIQECALSA
jgi:hypothetical protein